MGKLAIGALSFAAGAAAGALFVRWYVMRHAGGLAGEALGEKIFGAGSTGATIVSSVFNAIDEVRAQ